MRYTSEATMDDRGLRDVERWKDKIEVRLDNRQVFFLFFGSALVACLLFVLGVIVGKRLESRGRAVAPEMEDPLALLDKVAASTVGAATPPRSVPAAKPVAEAPKAAPPAPKPVAEAPKPAPPAPKPVAEAPKAAPPAPKPVAEAPKPAAPAPKPVVETPKAAVVAPKPVVETPRPVAAEAPKPAADAPKTRSRFALQIGSFPDRAEAEAFAKRFGPESPYVVPSEIPGKGTWFRVRVGEYSTAKDAIAAKTAFEKQHSVIALVVPPPPASPATTAAAAPRTSAPR
jgi:cell division septation protein DedD